MFAFITIGTKNLSKSSKFYDEILKPLNIFRIINEDRYVGYAKKANLQLIQQGKSELIEFYLMLPFNKKKATFGNGSMIVFKTKTSKIVDEFHQISLINGATSEGSPGPRHNEHYYAYIRDLDGNKICAFASS